MGRCASHRLGAAAFLALASACAERTTPPAAPAVVEALDCPAADGSGQARLVSGADGRLYLAWIEGAADTGHALRFSVLTDEGAWAAPRTIASGNDWFVNWADFPTLAALADGTLAAHWLVRKEGGTYAYDVRIAISTDGGATWSAAFQPYDDDSPTEHGFVSLVPADDRFSFVWLDGRLTSGHGSGATTLRHAWVDRTGRTAEETLVDERVCDCCPTAAVRASDGAVVMAYRDRSPAEIRDISFTRLEADGFRPTRSLHDDGWETAACPVNGPALATSAERVAAAWFTMAGNRASVFLAVSTDGGRSFGPPIRIDEGRPVGRVGIALEDDGSAIVSWIEQDGEQASIRVRRVSADLEPESSIVVAATSAGRPSGYPQIALHRGRAFLAWTEAAEGRPARVRTARLGA